MSLRSLHRIAKYALCFSLLMNASCDESFESATVRETVLHEGQSVRAANSNGTVEISFIGPTTRKYVWDGNERVVNLKIRETRFQGKLGIYDPANSWLFSRQERLVLEEAIRSFDNEEQMMAALIESRDYLDWVYTEDGLVVGFGQTSSRRQVNIDLWQFLLRGQKPTHLSGARPDRIQLKTVARESR